MIDIEVEGVVFRVPTAIEEVRLSQAIEYSHYHSEYVKCINDSGGKYGSAAYEIQKKALSAVLGGQFLEVSDSMKIGEYSPKSLENTFNKILYLIDSCILTYSPPAYSGEYVFDYKGKKWVIPEIFYEGGPHPDITYGMYIEAIESINLVQKASKESELDIRFTSMLRLIASIVRERGKGRDETILEYQEIADTNCYYFEEVNMKVGYDIDFFLSTCILI